MKEKRNDFLAEAESVWRIGKVLFRAVLEQGGGSEEIVSALSNQDLLKRIAEMIIDDFEKPEGPFEIIIDYERSLGEMIRAGNYNWVSDGILEQEGVFEGKRGEQETEAFLFSFSKRIAIPEIKEKMEKKGFQPARIEHLLAFGATYPEFQKKFPIICLGSTFRETNIGPSLPRVPALVFEQGKRCLCLKPSWHLVGWEENCRFLAVRR